MKLDPNTHRGQVILAVVIRAALAKRAVDLKEEAAGQDQPAPGVTARIVERTPHMDVSPQPPLRPGMAFTVRVYVDREKARPGEDTETVAVEDGARVQVRLVVTPHFAVKSSPVDWIEIRGTQDRSEAPAFHLRVKSADKLRGHKPKANVPPPAIIALFFHNGRPSGKVSRKIDIMDFAAITPPPGAAPEATLESTPPPAPMIAIDPAAIPADLNVTVAEIDGSGGLHFSCTVQTDLLDDYRQGAEGPWPFKQGTDVIVRSYMDQFTRKKSPLATGLELRGAGLKFFEAAPKVFKKALWALIDAKKPLKSISIVSQEPYFPWELIIPCRDNERRDPLGVEFSIGRWVDRNVVSGRQQIPLVDSFVIAPQYADKRKELKFAKVEKDFVLATISGEAITPAIFVEVERKLGSQGRSLVHFVCHGKDHAGGVQTIDLEDDTLSSNGVLGMTDVKKAFAAKRPLVFLNACEMGRSSPALVGLSGFAISFIQIGASAVIAPLWSVEDDAAHEVAELFYACVRAERNAARRTPFADILRSIRAKAYQRTGAKDTYAAYCFYGDPLAG